MPDQVEPPALSGAMTADIVASTRDGIITVDRAGRLTYVNAEAEAIFGLARADSVGQTFAEVFLPQEGLDAFSDCVIEAIRNPTVPHTADVTIGGGDARRHLSVRATLLQDSVSGQPEGVLVLVSDVSERVELLENSAARERERAATGRFIITILTIFSVFTLLLKPIQQLAQTAFFDLGPVLALLTLVVIAFLITRWTGSSLRTYGVTLTVRRRDLWDSVIWSLALCGLMTIGKWIWLMQDGGGNGTEPVFAFFVLDDGTRVTTVGLFAFGLSVYLVSVLFQEFATRCAIQAPLERFLNGVLAHPGWVANLTATLLFAVLHAHLNPIVSLTVIPVSLLWGWLFMRSGTVLTPIISHTIIGVYAIFILGVFAGLDQI